MLSIVRLKPFGLGVMCLCMACQRSGDVPTKEKSKQAPMQVSAQVLQLETQEKDFYATGSLVADDHVVISSEIPGKIIALSFTEGGYVEKGQWIAKLNDAEMQAMLRKLQIQEELAEKKESRKKQLFTSHGLSADEYESSLNEWNILKAEINILKEQIEKTNVRAPFKGRIGFKQTSVGAFVQPGNPIAQLVKLDPMLVEFSIPENQSSSIKLGQKVRLHIEAQAKEIQAEVFAIEPMIELNSRSLKVRARFPNSNHQYKPGGFARVYFSHATEDKSILIPNETLVPILKGYKVFTFSQGVVKEVLVQTGNRNENHVAIQSGLKPGDTLITSGIMRLKEGMKVELNFQNSHE